MNRLINKIAMLLFTAALSTAAAADVDDGNATKGVPNDDQVQTEEPTRKQKVYHFQHQIIPRWTHDSNGAFFNYLNNDRINRLIATASQIVSPEFSAAISVKKYPDARGLLISFPAPTETPECYYIYIHKNNDGNKFSLFTYEKTRDLFKHGDKGVIGSWSDKSHSNFGTRTYEDSDSFVSDVQNIIMKR